MNSTPLRLTTQDQLELRGTSWTPSDIPYAAVVIVHGLGEHHGRYGNVVDALTEAGYAVTAFDLRGHGKSDGRRGFTPSYDALLDDIDAFLGESSRRFSATPQFLLGHSMGGNLALNYVLRRKPSIAGVIALAPALHTAFDPPAWKLALGRLAYRIWPGLTFSDDISTTLISRDPHVVAAANADPLIHHRISARLGIDLLTTGQWALDHAHELTLPLLLMHGDGDRITASESSQEFATRVGERCTFRLWRGLYHELHNEPEKDQVLGMLVEWMDGRETGDGRRETD